MESIVLNLLSGLTFGSVLFILAAGYSMVIGVMGILNVAHGSIFMVGGYVAWTIAVNSKFNFGLAILAGGLVGALIGLVLERVFLRHMYGQIKEQAVLTAGFNFILTNLCLWIWGPIPRAPFVPASLYGVSHIVVDYPIYRIVIIIIGLISFAGLWWLQDKTRIGAIVRAGMDNADMVKALGINLGVVFTIAFLVTTAIAGIAGAVALQIMGTNLSHAIEILILALVIVVVGGVGSIQGAFLGAMLVGLVDTFGRALFPQLAMFTIFLAMIVIILVRPLGLLGRKGSWG